MPADDKKNAHLIIAQIVVEVLSQLDMAYPQASAQRKRELRSIRKTLVKA